MLGDVSAFICFISRIVCFVHIFEFCQEVVTDFVDQWIADRYREIQHRLDQLEPIITSLTETVHGPELAGSRLEPG